MRFPRSRILVFAKAPVAGAVKTRLIPALGAAGAARLHARLVERTVALACGAGLAPVVLCGAPDTGHPFFTVCANAFPVRLQPQQGADLGERMDRALAHALSEAESAVLVGSDLPELEPAYLAAALTALDEGADAVFGPAEDGGYMLVGLRRSQPALFRDMPWSTAGVMAVTRERLRALGLTWRELPVQWDLDRPEDLERLRRRGGERP